MFIACLHLSIHVTTLSRRHDDMPKPFPFPIRIGTDICHITRIFNILTNENGRKAQAFVSKVLTEQEILISKNRLAGLELLGKNSSQANNAEPTKSPAHHRELDPKKQGEQAGKAEVTISPKVWNNTVLRTATFLAGRFAAKEAAMKALQGRHIGFHDIIVKPGEVINGRTSAPTAMVRPEEHGAQWEEIMLSVSHDGEYASASVIAVNGQAGYRRVIDWKAELRAREEQGPKKLVTDEDKGIWSVFVGDVAKEATEDDLMNAFARFGAVDKAIIAKKSGGESVGYGFVSFRDKKAAQDAINYCNDVRVFGKEVYTRTAKPRHEVLQPGDSIMEALGFDSNGRELQSAQFEIVPNPGAYTVFVGNLYRGAVVSDLTMAFGHLPSFICATLSCRRDGRNLGYGFVAFGKHKDARRAIRLHKRLELGYLILHVGREKVRTKMVVDARDNGDVVLMSEKDRIKDIRDLAAAATMGRGVDETGVSSRIKGRELIFDFTALTETAEEKRMKQGEEVEFWIKAQEVLRGPSQGKF